MGGARIISECGRASLSRCQILEGAEPPPDGVLEILHDAVQLQLVHRFQDSSHLRTGRDAELHQVPPEQDRRRRLVLDAERAGAVDEPVHRRTIERARSAVAIRAGEADQQLQVDLLRQSPERAVGHRVFRLVERARTQVLGDQPQHLRADVEVVERSHVQAIENPCRRLDALRLVIRRSHPPVDHRRGRRLAEVVAHRAQHHGRQPRAIEIGVPLARLVDHHQRVDPDVAFGMPLGILRAVVERLHLRKDLLDHAELAREREPDRRPLRLQQQLLELAPDALGRQIVERNRRAERRGGGIDGELEPRGKLQGTEDTERVVCERRRIDDPENTEFEVRSGR